MADGLGDPAPLHYGAGDLASSYGGHARRNLWQRGLAFARPPPYKHKVDIFVAAGSSVGAASTV